MTMVGRYRKWRWYTWPKYVAFFKNPFLHFMLVIVVIGALCAYGKEDITYKYDVGEMVIIKVTNSTGQVIEQSRFNGTPEYYVRVPTPEIYETLGGSAKRNEPLQIVRFHEFELEKADEH